MTETKQYIFKHEQCEFGLVWKHLKKSQVFYSNDSRIYITNLWTGFDKKTLEEIFWLVTKLSSTVYFAKLSM